MTIPAPPPEMEEVALTEEEKAVQEAQKKAVAVLQKTVSATNIRAKDILEALKKKTSSRPPKT